jgi:hypothetical protein
MTDDGGTEINATPEAEVIYNTWQQIGPDGWAISKHLYGGTVGQQDGWMLWRCVHTYRHDVIAMRRENDHAGTWRERRNAALATLMQQAVAITGVPADGWVRNGMGDYVPREVAKARPLRRLDSKR